MKEIWRNPASNKIGFIRYTYDLVFLHFSGDRNQVSKGKIHHWNRPYANFGAGIGGNRLFSYHAWMNNEGSWGAYYIILYNWTIGIGFSCYGHYPHCDRRGSYLPRLQKVESEYRTDIGKPWRWILLKLGRISWCEYLHPNETHYRWEKLQEYKKTYG